MAAIIANYKINRYLVLVMDSPQGDFLNPLSYLSEIGLTSKERSARLFKSQTQAINHLIGECLEWGRLQDVPLFDSKFYVHDKLTEKVWNIDFFLEDSVLKWREKQLPEDRVYFILEGHEILDI